MSTAGLMSCGSNPSREETDFVKIAPGMRVTKGKMTYRRNPNTGHNISLLGYGTRFIPTIRPGRYSLENIDQNLVNRMVKYAVDHGVNYFNTSPVFGGGFSETVLGIALKNVPREKLYVATKISNFKPSEFSLEKCKEMFEHSLHALQTPYIDNILLHDAGFGGLPTFKARFIDNGLLDYLKRCRDRQKIYNIGVSLNTIPKGGYKSFEYAMELHDKGVIDWGFIQLPINYVDWYHHSHNTEKGFDSRLLYEELYKRGIPVVATDPIQGGKLGNLPRPIMSRLYNMRPEDSMSSWAIRFVASLPGVVTVVTGISYMEHLKDNIYALSPLTPLSNRESALIEDISDDIASHPLVTCINCGHCMPCEFGVDIPRVFNHYNKCLNDGMVEPDTRSPEYARKRRAFLIGIDGSVPRLRQADRCVECGECVAKCPRQIDIPATMRRIGDYAEALRANKSDLI